MTTPLHYEYSTTFLHEHMPRLSRQLVVGIVSACWLTIAVCAVVWLVKHLSNI